MNKTQKTQEEKQSTIKSDLDKFKLFFEHTDDNRIVVDTKAQPVKRPSRNIASKR